MSKKEKVTKEVNSKKELKKAKRLAIAKEKLEVENQIDALVDRKKATKDKEEKKNLAKEIKTLKEKRNNIGKKDTFFSDVRAEMKLVRWPSGKEVLKYSIACLVFIVFFALFFYGLKSGFSAIVDLFNK